MSTPTPQRERPYPSLPPVSLELRALVEFNRGMNEQLSELEERFYRPREHAIITPSEPLAGRMAPKKPK